MSMSQEEIEALMNDTDDEVVSEVEVDESSSDTTDEDDMGNIDDLLANIDDIVDNASDADDVDIDDIDIDIDEPNMDDIIASIDGIELEDEEEENKVEEYTLPVASENKVVDQLNEVAADSEEKASQIFDVLSYILDRNEELEKTNKSLIEFMNAQIKLLESLAVKFPNVQIFEDNLETAKALLPDVETSSTKLTDENNKIFEAMELMQYHDINRQKIERVMAVIRKLSGYLNGIFEDNSDKPEVQIAKHISGDSHETVDADDIDSLINQYS